MRLLRSKNEGSMKELMRKRACGLVIAVVAIAVILRAPLRAEQLSLQAIVTPTTTILKDGRPLTFAVHGFIEFKSLAELFPYIDSQTKRWNGRLDARSEEHTSELQSLRHLVCRL